MFEVSAGPRPLLALAVVVLLAGGCASAAPPPAAWPSVPQDDDPGLPPIARLVLADGTVAAGRLGSFAYRESYADAPWSGAGLEPIIAADRQPLTVALRPGSAFRSWRASFAAADDPTGDRVMPLAGGEADGPDLAQASFDPPAAGAWVIQVRLTFPEEEGDATYYWRLEVP